MTGPLAVGGELLPEVLDHEVVAYVLGEIQDWVDTLARGHGFANAMLYPGERRPDPADSVASFVQHFTRRALSDRVTNRALRILGGREGLRTLVAEELSAALDAQADSSPEAEFFAKSLDWHVCSPLGAWLLKSTGAPKYTRKVPTGRTTPSGKLIYRYYYSDASTAHGAREGEHINARGRGVHEVVSVDHHKVVLRHRETGATRELTHDDLHAELAEVYRERFEKGAERLVRRFLAQAKADGKVARVNHDDPKAALRAYGNRFAAAKVPAEHARRIVSFLAARPGWEGEAKQALLTMASDASMGRRVSANARQITRAAEHLRNADGAPKVRASHVGEATLLRLPDNGFETRLAEMRRVAAVDLGKAEALLGGVEAAGSNEAARRAMVDYAEAMLGSTVSVELERMAQAFPGLRDVPELEQAKRLQAKWDALRAERAGARKPDGRGIAGTPTTVYIADAEGNPTPQRARYRLVEATDAIASHDPTKGFQSRKDYPEGVQERAYHRDKAEQDKVRTNARKLQPAYVVNTNPDAVNGPPVMTADGVVLGGNSRTMSLQLAYADSPEAAERYKAYLKEHAHEFGFAHGDVDAMKAPILVREVEVGEATKDQLGVLVRRYNESFTQGMDPRVDQVARGRMVTEGMLETLAAGMDRTKDTGEPLHPTLNAFLSSSDGARFVRDLQSAREGKAIIDRRNRSQFVGKDGKLNEDGKTFVERVLVGHYLPDPDLLSEMLPKHVAAISGVVPHLVRAARNGHDLRGALRTALEAHAYMRRRDLASVSEYERDSGGFASLGVEGFEAKPQLDARSKRLLVALVDRIDKPVQMAAYFRDFATHARRNPAGQGDLAGGSRSTEDLLDLAGGQQGDRRGQMGLFKALRLAPLALRRAA